MNDRLQEYGGGSFWYVVDDDTVTVGVTGAGIESLGTIKSIEFSEVGDEFCSGDWIAEVIGSDGSLEVLAPEDLSVEELNSDLAKEPSYLDDDPTGDGWLLRAKRVSRT